MEKKLTKGKQSNYEIQLTVTEDEKKIAREKMLKQFQKDMDVPGFRKGQAPLSMVEEKVKPEYLNIGVYEEIINEGLRQVLKENPDTRFIGEPYDINNEDKDSKTILTIKLDVFPEVEIKDKKWEKETIKPIKTEVTKEDEENAMMQLKKNYADYKDGEEITKTSVSKVSMKYLDKDGAELDKGTTFVGEQEFDEFDFFVKNFIGKKKDEEFEVKYTKKDFPPIVAYKKEEGKPAKVEFTVTDIKEVTYPEMNEEMIKKLFGDESEVKTEKDLKEYITKTLSDNKFDTELVKAVEDYLQKVSEGGMEIEIPTTLVNEEFKSRFQSLHQRFGGEENMKKYFEQMGEEKAKEFTDDIKKSATESLQKFFILQQVLKGFELDVNWQQPGHLEAEKKLYEHFNGGAEKKPAAKKAPAKKPAAKKTTKKD